MLGVCATDATPAAGRYTAQTADALNAWLTRAEAEESLQTRQDRAERDQGEHERLEAPQSAFTAAPPSVSHYGVHRDFDSDPGCSQASRIDGEYPCESEHDRAECEQPESEEHVHRLELSAAETRRRPSAYGCGWATCRRAAGAGDRGRHEQRDR
jgi:hypothetical protein